MDEGMINSLRKPEEVLDAKDKFSAVEQIDWLSSWLDSLTEPPSTASVQAVKQLAIASLNTHLSVEHTKKFMRATWDVRNKFPKMNNNDRQILETLSAEAQLRSVGSLWYFDGPGGRRQWGDQ